MAKRGASGQSGSGVSQPAAKKRCASGQSGSGASQPAECSSAVQKLVEDIRTFGRMPKQNQGTSEEARAENKLAKRFSDHRDSIPDDVLQELRGLGSAPQLAELSSAVQQLVEDVKQFGRWPTRGKTASPEEKKLAQRLSSHKESIPADVWQELLLLGRASQPAEDEQLVAEVQDLEDLPEAADPAAQHAKTVQLLVQEIKELGHVPRRDRMLEIMPASLPWSHLLWELIQLQEPTARQLLEEVLSFGRLPHQIKNPTNEPERRETQLAFRITKHKKLIRGWEAIQDHCATVVTVNGSDEAELAFACARIIQDDPSKVKLLSVNAMDGGYDLSKPTPSSIAAKLTLLAQACPHLLEFRVRYAPFAKKVFSDALQAIGQACPQLLRLDLGANDISDGALEVVSRACPLLEHLDLRESGIGDAAIQAVARSCTRLEELNVTECVNLTDVSFLAIAHGCPRLRSLTIWDSFFITETAEHMLQRPKVTDIAISTLAQQCPHIERLELCGLESLTDAAVHAVARGCRYLSYLDASLCCQLTNAAIQSLVHHSFDLSSLKLRHCSRITTSGASALAQISLKYLDVRPLQLSNDILRECEVAGRKIV